MTLKESSIHFPKARESDISQPQPKDLESFIGQEQLKQNLTVFIEAAKKRKSPIDHTLLFGPPGLGKTTLAQVIAKELGSNFKSTAGPILSKAADIGGILTGLKEGDVLFIDEIHRLNIALEEVLYGAMENFSIDIIIGEGQSSRTVKIPLPKFTLIGATTRLGLLSNPLRDRFGIQLQLEFYRPHTLKDIIVKSAPHYGVLIEESGAMVIAARSRGTPRIALRLLRRVADFAVVSSTGKIGEGLVNKALKRLEVDSLGLSSSDHKYLRFISETCNGGPVGIEAIAAALSEQKDTIEDTIEPYMIQIGFIKRTHRGRVISQAARQHLHSISCQDS